MSKPKQMKYYYDTRCCVCGKFCKPVATAIEYGGYFDIDPPDPVFWCNKCATIIKTKQFIDCYWIKPNFIK